MLFLYFLKNIDPYEKCLYTYPVACNFLKQTTNDYKNNK